MFTHLTIFSAILVFGLAGASARAQTLASISYKSAKNRPVTINISLKEFIDTYNTARQVSANTPPVKQFFEEYLRYRVGVEAAYNNPALIKNPGMRNMFADHLLKEGFEQLLYKTLADKKLKTKIAEIDQKARKLPKNTMLKFYRQNPEFDFHFIVITFPAEPTKKQVQNARARAQKIYGEVKKSKKPFPELINIYSDDRLSGQLNLPRPRHLVYPTIYEKLKKMKDGQISSPIKTSTGFYIVRLNRKIPFGEANRTQIKTAYFDQKRSQALAQYFNSLKKKYKVQANKDLLDDFR